MVQNLCSYILAFPSELTEHPEGAGTSQHLTILWFRSSVGGVRDACSMPLGAQCWQLSGHLHLHSLSTPPWDITHHQQKRTFYNLD